MTKNYLTLLFILLFAQISLSQQSVNVAGGNSSGANGSISFSVGQVFYTSNTSSSGSIFLGVQQPSEFFPLNVSLFEADVNSVFPNPTNGFFNIKLAENPIQKLQFFLIDSNGKQVKKGVLQTKETSVDIQNLSAGVYFLKLMDSRSSTKTYKIIKS